MLRYTQPPSSQTFPLTSAQTRWDALRWPLAWGLSISTTLLVLAALATGYRPLPSASPRQLHAELGPTPAPATIREAPSARPQPAQSAQAKRQATGPKAPEPIIPPRLIPAPPPPEMPAAPQAASTEPHSPIAAAGAVNAAPPGNPPSSAADKGMAGGGASAPPRSGQDALSIRCPSQIKPAFPKLALEDSINRGEVRARLLLDAEGHVTGVDILEATPPGYFENAVRKAALQWHCQSGQASSVVVPFSFQAR